MLLSGIKVVEVGQALAGPLAGVIMADMGADVIKIEKPDGGDDGRGWGPPFVEGTSVFFHAMNRNKRSVTLDIKDPGDVEKLKALVRDADILIQNLRPGIVDQLGIGADVMMKVNPRLIYCSIWAFGHKGPMRGNPGFDPLLQAFGAVMTLTGRPDDPPTFQAPAINDKATGMWCAIGALAALQQRHRTGKGCVIDTSLFEASVAWVETQINGYKVTGNVPPRHGTGSANLVPYQVFDTADRPVCIAAGNPRLFAKFSKVVGHPEWPEDERFSTGPKRSENRKALVALIEPILKTATRAEWIARFEAAGVPVAPLNDIPELIASEQMAAMDMARKLPDSGLEVIGLPLSVDKERPQPVRGAPALGQHNEEVFAELKAAANGDD